MRADDARQGWKLHVSATILSAEEVLGRVEPILRKADVLFKKPVSLEFLKVLNSGLAGYSQVGKFVTVYPRTTAEARELAPLLHRATRGLVGPKVPFDLPYRKGSLVSYRYGRFLRAPGEPAIIRSPDGKGYKDERSKAATIPAWSTDPFPRRASKQKRWRGLITKGIGVSKVLSQRGKGGVYEGVDFYAEPIREVIVKEGRRHGETNWDGRDGLILVRHESRVLRQLRKAGLPVPQVLREFDYGRNHYLILERFVGQPIRSKNPQRSWKKAANLLDELAPLLERIHKAGWVWRDCKPEHVLRSSAGLQLIDFEGACRMEETDILPWGAPDYLPVSYWHTTSRKAGVLEDNFALGVIGFEFMCGKVPPRSYRSRLRYYREAKCPKSLQERIETLLLSPE